MCAVPRRTIRLTTQRLTIRPLARHDITAFTRYRNLPDVARFQDWTLPYARDLAHALVDDAERFGVPTPGQWLQLAVTNDADRLLGDVAVWLDEAALLAMVGYTFAPENQGRGYAIEAVSAVLEWLFTVRKGHRVAATIGPENLASPRVQGGPGVQPGVGGIPADGDPFCVMMVAEPMPAQPHPYLWRLMVDWRHQGRGIGRAAIEQLAQRRVAEGATHLLLSCTAELTGTPEPFYRGLGFERTGKVNEWGETEMIAPLERLIPSRGNGEGAQPAQPRASRSSMPRWSTRRRTAMSGSMSTTIVAASPSRGFSVSSGKSSTTMRSVAAWAPIWRAISSCIAGCTMALRAASAARACGSSPNTSAATAARSSEPSERMICCPKRSAMRASTGECGVCRLRAISSASTIAAPCSASNADTVDFPDPMPPVKPTSSTA